MIGPPLGFRTILSICQDCSASADCCLNLWPMIVNPMNLWPIIHESEALVTKIASGQKLVKTLNTSMHPLSLPIYPTRSPSFTLGFSTPLHILIIILYSIIQLIDRMLWKARACVSECSIVSHAFKVLFWIIFAPFRYNTINLNMILVWILKETYSSNCEKMYWVELPSSIDPFHSIFSSLIRNCTVQFYLSLWIFQQADDKERERNEFVHSPMQTKCVYRISVAITYIYWNAMRERINCCFGIKKNSRKDELVQYE